MIRFVVFSTVVTETDSKMSIFFSDAFHYICQICLSMGRNPCQRLHLFPFTFSTYFSRISDSHVDEMLSIRVMIWLLFLYLIALNFVVSWTHHHLRLRIVRLAVYSSRYPTYRTSRRVFLRCKLSMRCYYLLIKRCSLAGVCMLRTEAFGL